MMNFIPFAKTRHGVIRPYLHAMFSIKAMLRVAEKGNTSATEDDLSGCFGEFLEKPDPDLLDIIKSNVNTAAATAALVFMHSAYENAVFDLMKQLVHYDPEPWLKCIDEKSIPFKRLREDTLADIRNDLLEKWLEKAERESFPWKVSKLLAVLQPGTLKDVISGFEFSMDDFKQIDQLRHNLTHQPNFATAIPDINDKLSYLHRTVFLLEKLAEQKYPGQPSED